VSQQADEPVTNLDELDEVLIELKEQGYTGFEFDDVGECMRFSVLQRRRDVAV
jgi:hypothetical protein